MAAYRASASVSADATTLTITHNLNNSNAVMVKATPSWNTTVFINGAKTVNAIPLAFENPVPAGGGTVDVEVQG